MRQFRVRRAAGAASAIALLGFLAVGHDAPAGAMSCFAVAGKMTCIDAASTAGTPPMPPIVAPSGNWQDGEDHEIVIEDDGGRHVARG